MPKKYEKQLEEKFTFISQNYSGHIKELITKLKDKDNEIMLLNEKHENEILKCKLELKNKDYEMEKQNTKIVECEKNNEILQLKLQLAELKK